MSKETLPARPFVLWTILRTLRDDCIPTSRHLLVGLRHPSGIENARQRDMCVAAGSKSFWHAVGKQFGSMIIFVNKTYSETGEVKLKTADWRNEPIIDSDYVTGIFRALDMLDFRLLQQYGSHRAV
jgi:hypothetical protein